MKKFISLMVSMIVGLVALMAWSCDDDKNDKDAPISFESLPQAAQTFIHQYYPSDKVVYVSREGKNNRTSYDVTLASGHEVEFDATGQWTDVDAPAQQYVPEGIVPQPISEYVATNFPAYGINEISRKSNGGYEVELTNGLELPFDRDGIFIGHLN
ncbi:MAG: PepSY-like domain-containing protein [Duncaniella sp.]|nr:PepSY-like domain-containing protein [Duncaniella sp.]MDE5751198.1 PepSY-like domain-containing protein [Duncaniella sp.]MDE6328108.1 PepSY-like domain-containing protein [Duncaniella sp.]MDE6465572.1 PepSY-like domain-containing protein [Duncaniella sp.]